jgi:2-polyprenyl-3-methyl-5-hydroxy-6-metoxy-1,4-benzoquinol methylase
MSEPFLRFERVNQCPSCGSNEIRVAIDPDIGQCDACGLLFRNPRPTQAEIARSYDSGGTFAAWQEQEQARAEMWDRRAVLVCRFQPFGQLLDVGTGDGRFLRTCRDLGYDVVGTEVSEAGASYARRSGFDVKMGQITDIELLKESFDIATIWHVLEHVPEPGAVLRKVHSLLRTGGILIVAVPNEENFFVRKRLKLQQKLNPFGPLPFGGEIHLTYFRPLTLIATLRTAGFELLEFGVDDLYFVRDWRTKIKLLFQQTAARFLRWHFAVAMYAVCRRCSAAKGTKGR